MLNKTSIAVVVVVAHRNEDEKPTEEKISLNYYLNLTGNLLSVLENKTVFLKAIFITCMKSKKNLSNTAHLIFFQKSVIFKNSTLSRYRHCPIFKVILLHIRLNNIFHSSKHLNFTVNNILIVKISRLNWTKISI